MTHNLYYTKNDSEFSHKKTKETTSSQVRVVIVERENLYRKGIKKVLEEEPDLSVVGDFTNVTDAQLPVYYLEPNVIVTDRLSDEDDYSVNTSPYFSIISDCPGVNVFLLINDTDLKKLRNVDLSRIKGCLLKSAEIEELIQGVRAVAANRPFFCKEMGTVTMRAIENARTTKKTDTSITQTKKLTPRELEVIYLLTSGLSRKEIAKRLFISVKTVSSHRENILSKLNLKNNSDLVRYALLTDISEQVLSTLKK